MEARNTETDDFSIETPQLLQISDDIDIGMKYPDFLEPNKVQIQSNLTPYNLFSFSCSYCMVLLVVGKQC